MIHIKLATDFTNSLNTDNKTVWVGEGLGGGTLHFGLQYMNHPDVINKNHSDLLTIINNMATITNAQKIFICDEFTEYSVV